MSPEDGDAEDTILARVEAATVGAVEPGVVVLVERQLAARRWPTVQHYADAKSEVIRAILAGSRGA